MSFNRRAERGLSGSYPLSHQVPFRWLAIALALLATACFLDELSGPKSRHIVFSVSGPSFVSLGDTSRLRATTARLVAGPSRVEWSSSDPLVATVDSTGLVRGIALGNDTIRLRLVTPEMDTTLIHPIQVLQLASPDSSKVTAVPQSVRSGDSVSLWLRARDKFGHDLTTGGDTVLFTNAGGTSTCTTDSTSDHHDGTYSATCVGKRAGTPTTIHATINQKGVTSTLPTVTVQPGSPAGLENVVGDGQSATVGTKVGVAPKVRVVDVNDNPVPEVAVAFTVTGGGGVVYPTTSVPTDSSGVAAVGWWLLGTTPGNNTLTAAAGSAATVVRFTAMGTTPVVAAEIRLGNSLLVQSPRRLAIDAPRDRIYVLGSEGLSVIDARADTANHLVSTGGNPSLIAVDSVTGRIYVATADTLAVYDGGTLSGLTRATLRGGITGVVALPNRFTKVSHVWVAVGSVDSLFVLDGTSLQILGSISLPDPGEIAANPATDRVYVTTSSGLVVVDASFGTVTMIPRPLDGSNIAVNPLTNRIYASSQFGLEVFDGAAGLWVDSVPLFENPLVPEVVLDISLDEIRNRVYATAYRPFTEVPGFLVAVMDGATGIVVRVPTGRPVEGVVANPSTNRAYAAVVASVSAVLVIDGALDAVSAAVVRVGFLSGVAVDEANERVYVLDSNTNCMFVIDGASDSVAGLPIPLLPSALSGAAWAIALDSSLHRIYITHAGASGDVEVLDDQIYRSLGTVSVGLDPRGIAVNQLTHEVYVAAAGDGAVAVVDGRTLSVIDVLPMLGSYAVAIDEPRNLVVVVSPNNFTVIDGAAKIKKNWTVDYSGAWGVVLNPLTKRAYGPLSYDDDPNRVAIIDYTVGRRDTAVAISGYAEGIGANPTTNVVFVPTDVGIDVVSGDLPGRVLTLFRPMSTRGPGVAINRVTGRVYMADPASNRVVVIQN